MAGFTQAEQQATLDARYPTTGATDHVGYSTNGTSETGIVARTPIGATGWAAATAASPSVKANAALIVSADATGSGTITHHAVFSAATGGTQRTDWQALTDPKDVNVGDSLKFPVGLLKITLD
jgi:hypothetical protein